MGFEVEDNVIYKVITDKAKYEAEFIVNCTGVWTNELLRELEVELPIRIAREDVLYVSQVKSLIPFGWGDFVHGFYSRPDGGTRYLIGGLEPEYDGFEPEPGEYASPPINVIEDRLGRASKRFPPLTYAEPVAAIYGFYDVTPDFQPIIGFDERYNNLIHLVGLSGHGFKLAPAYGKAVEELVKYGNARTFNVKPFSIKRFTEGRQERGRYKYGLIG